MFTFAINPSIAATPANTGNVLVFFPDTADWYMFKSIADFQNTYDYGRPLDTTSPLEDVEKSSLWSSVYLEGEDDCFIFVRK